MMTESSCFEFHTNKERSRSKYTFADCNAKETIRSPGPRPCTDHGDSDVSPQLNMDKSSQAYSTKLSLPRGVIRGCLRCNNCQKVTARWLPESGCGPVLDAAPVFYPNEEEFKDTLKYIASIRPIAEPYGICRIVPPASWQPPCPLRDKIKWQKTRFHTRVQQIHKLQIRQSVSTNVNGGCYKKRRLSRMSGHFGHEQYVSDSEAECLAPKEDGNFGFDSGPEFTLEAFQKYANEFKDQYFRVQEVESNSDCIDLGGLKGRWAPSVENIEGEYWRVVEKPTEQIEVLYGADVETRKFGSGFPKVKLGAPTEVADFYAASGWNLNNIARLPGSMLSFEDGDISGVVVPWLYIGMCFSSFCWHVEDHHFYSLNYLHWGAPKVWYGVPGYAAVKFEHAMRKHLPDLFEEQPDLLQKLVTQLSPSILKSEGVPVYRCVQQAGEFVLTFPRAYHGGFNCGFNCAEAVNVAPVDWLPHGQNATELYQELCRKTTVSHDKLLLGTAREAIKILWEFSMLKRFTSINAGWHGFCGKEGLLTKALKARAERERVRVRRACLGNCLNAKMDSNFDAVKERECFLCYYDLHFSAIGCECSPEKFACLEHANQLCACPWNRKCFLYRYDVTELDILIEALEGKRNSINTWAKHDLGLASSSCVTILNTQKDFMKDASSFSPSKSIVTSKTSPSKDLPLISETADVLDRQNSKVLARAQNSESTNGVETIVLSDDEEDDNGSLGEERKIVSMQKLVTVGAFDDADHSNSRTAVIVVSAEEDVHNCKIEQNIQKLTNTRDISFTYKQNHLNREPANLKNCTADESQINPDQINSNGSADMPLSVPRKPFSHLGTSFRHDTKELEDLSPTETSLRSRASCKSKSLEEADVAGKCPKPQEPCYIAASNNIKMHEQIGVVSGITHLDNEGKVHSGYPNMYEDFQRDLLTASKLPVKNASYDVDLLDIGVIQPSKSWYDSRTIFPRGYKSRVRFYSVLDPTQTCSYISEVLDAEVKQPLFKVTVEGHPTEVFMHVSVQKCWELVQERLNKQIMQQRSLGRDNIPPLRPPETLDGHEMFGFTSPPIVEAIETLDPSHQYAEYWATRPHASQVQVVGGNGNIMQQDTGFDFEIVRDSKSLSLSDSSSQVNRKDESSMIKLMQGKSNIANQVSTENVSAILGGLFKRAKPNELWTLHKVLSSEYWSSDCKAAFMALKEELKKL